MIYDKLENLEKYPILGKIKEFLDFHAAFPENDEKYIIDESCYVFKSKYRTREATDRFEAHKKYIDLQIILSGREYVYTSDISEGIQVEAYDEQRDIAFYQTKNAQRHVLNEDTFVLFDSNDLHQCGVKTENPTEVTKLVFKLKK